jgi:hypothetical protein
MELKVRTRALEVRSDIVPWLAKWQAKQGEHRIHTHFLLAAAPTWTLRNVVDHLPRKLACLQELRWIYDRPELMLAHNQHAKSTNMLKRLNQELRGRPKMN